MEVSTIAYHGCWSNHNFFIMNHQFVTTLIIFLIPLLFVVGILFPSPGMVMALMLLAGLMVIIQVLVVLMAEEPMDDISPPAVEQEEL